jgi:hypothetical protein
MHLDYLNGGSSMRVMFEISNASWWKYDFGYKIL